MATEGEYKEGKNQIRVRIRGKDGGEWCLVVVRMRPLCIYVYIYIFSYIYILCECVCVKVSMSPLLYIYKYLGRLINNKASERTEKPFL